LLEGLTGFTFILILAVVVALIIMAIGNDIAPHGPDTAGKLAPYACGEDIAPQKVMVNVERFFLFAVFFMIFDVLGFVLVTTLARPDNIGIPLAYAASSLVSVAVLSANWRK
jgi:NADH:ubiquinone oxidoreductase subunit 3 (subunit A)